MTPKQEISNGNKESRSAALFNCFSDQKWVDLIVLDAQSCLTTCQSEVRRMQERINAFNSAINKEHKRLVDIQKNGTKHVWNRIRRKLEYRLNTEETKLIRKTEKQKEEEQFLTLLKDEISSAHKHLQQCQNAYAEYAKTQRMLNGLL